MGVQNGWMKSGAMGSAGRGTHKVFAPPPTKLRRGAAGLPVGESSGRPTFHSGVRPTGVQVGGIDCTDTVSEWTEVVPEL
jgi:hypothetical protein